MNRLTTVTHPDGSVSKRTSKSHVYTYAVEVAIPRAYYVTEAEDGLERCLRVRAEVEAALADGTIVRACDPWSRSQTWETATVGGHYATSYDNRREIPSDDVVLARLARSLDSTQESERSRRKTLAKAQNMPETVYKTARWSSREDLARKAADGEFAFWITKGATVTVVPVDPTS